MTYTAEFSALEIGDVPKWFQKSLLSELLNKSIGFKI